MKKIIKLGNPEHLGKIFFRFNSCVVCGKECVGGVFLYRFADWNILEYDLDFYCNDCFQKKFS